ncbi:hypothetical protein HDU99_006082, partial [Rhizoclosmatium hyalinum]
SSSLRPTFITKERDVANNHSTTTDNAPYIPPTLFFGPNHPHTFSGAPGTKNAWLVRYTGPLITQVTVQPLYYGTVNFAFEIDQFYAGITQSPWMDIMSQYSVSRGTSSPHISVSQSMDYSKGYFSDELDIQPYLKSLVKSGVITPTANAYFPVHFAAGLKIYAFGEYSCSSWCGYHGVIDVSALNVGTQYL